MSIELTLIPQGSASTYALSDSRDIACVDLESPFTTFPVLDGTFAIFWLDQLQGSHVIGFGNECTNLLALIALPTVPEGSGRAQYYEAIMTRCHQERDSILGFLRKSLSFEGINGRCVRSFILYKLLRQLRLANVPIWQGGAGEWGERCGEILIGERGSPHYEPNRRIDVAFESSSNACLVIDLGEWHWN